LIRLLRGMLYILACSDPTTAYIAPSIDLIVMRRWARCSHST